MSSSSDAVTAPGFGRELRTGTWTRLGARGGDRQILGDVVTEGLLAGLVEETRSAARAQGYATGWAEGRRAAEQEAAALRQQVAEHAAAEEERRDQEHRAAVDALLRAAADLQRATVEVAERIESHVTEVAVALTEELLGHELQVAQTPGLDAVRRALALAPGETVVRVRVSPEEAAEPATVEGFDKLNHRGGGDAAVQVVADPALRRGEAVVETDQAVLDARVWGAMDRVREVLAR